MSAQQPYDVELDLDIDPPGNDGLPYFQELTDAEVEVKAPVAQRKKPLRKATEMEMTRYLTRFHDGSNGNGPRYVVADHVRNRNGFGATRTADFMVVDTWQSLAVHGFEVKVDRRDWLKETRQPEKSEAFKQYCHYWWLVVPDEGLVRGDELPKDWGLMAIRGAHQGFTVDKLVVVKAAPKLEPLPMPWTMTVPLLRAVQRTARGSWEG